jgi:hypothetical protein
MHDEINDDLISTITQLIQKPNVRIWILSRRSTKRKSDRAKTALYLIDLRQLFLDAAKIRRKTEIFSIYDLPAPGRLLNHPPREGIRAV